MTERCLGDRHDNLDVTLRFGKRTPSITVAGLDMHDLVTTKYRTARACAEYTINQANIKVPRSLTHPLAAAALEPSTRKRYNSGLALFARYLVRYGIHQVNTSVLVDFYQHLYTCGYAYGTVSVANTAIADYLRTKKLPDITTNTNVINTLKGYKKLDTPARVQFQREAFTLDGFNSLMAYAASNADTYEYCILFSLGFFFLLRISEALDVTTDHFQVSTTQHRVTLTVIKGKTGWYQNITVLAKYVSTDIMSWINGTRRTMHRLNDKRANSVIKQWRTLHHVPHTCLSFHSLRHSGAYYYANLGLSQAEIKNIGRWKGTDTARHYYRKAEAKTPKQKALLQNARQMQS